MENEANGGLGKLAHVIGGAPMFFMVQVRNHGRAARATNAQASRAKNGKRRNEATRARFTAVDVS